MQYYNVNGIALMMLIISLDLTQKMMHIIILLSYLQT